jgi:hypothetical protein
MMMEQRERFGANPNRLQPNIPHPNPFGGAHRFGMGHAPIDFARHGLFGEEFERIY